MEGGAGREVEQGSTAFTLNQGRAACGEILIFIWGGY
jgi:hypothetical protein